MIAKFQSPNPHLISPSGHLPYDTNHHENLPQRDEVHEGFQEFLRVIRAFVVSYFQNGV
jgi:hypothetical protein